MQKHAHLLPSYSFLLYSLPHENRDAALISNYHMLLQLLRPYKL